METRMSAPLGSDDASTTSTTRPDATGIGAAASAPVVADRTCGRCRRPFPGDPELNFQTDWALCPDCSAVLMPRPAGTTTAPASS